MARKWNDREQVADGLRLAATRSLDAGKSIPIGIPGSIGVMLRRLRFRLMYESVVRRRLAERFETGAPASEMLHILRLAERLCAPQIWMYLGLIGSHAGFALFFLNWARARQQAARKLQTLYRA